MTFQVSDTAVRDAEMRRTVPQHSLIAYLFGTVVLATAVGLVAGLSGQPGARQCGQALRSKEASGSGPLCQVGLSRSASAGACHAPATRWTIE